MQDDTPVGETVYSARFYVDSTALVLTAGARFFHFLAFDGAADPVLRLGIKYSELLGEKRLFLEAIDDVGGVATTENGSELVLPDGWNWVEVGWEVSPDTVLYLRQATCDGPELACNDDAAGLSTSTLALANLPAGTYHLFVDSDTTSNAVIELDVYITPPGPSSDRCGAPTLVPFGATSLSGSTCGFAVDYQPTTPVTGCPVAESGAAEDRVFYFVLPAARTVTVDGCTAGSNYDQTLYLRSVCTDEASQIGCNDDGCGGLSNCTGNLRSSLQQVLQPGLYHLFVDGYPGSCPCGTFSFNLNGF